MSDSPQGTSHSVATSFAEIKSARITSDYCFWCLLSARGRDQLAAADVKHNVRPELPFPICILIERLGTALLSKRSGARADGPAPRHIAPDGTDGRGARSLRRHAGRAAQSRR